MQAQNPRRDGISNAGSIGRTLDAHAKHGDKDGVQNNVDERAQHEPYGSQSGFPVHADEIRERQAARDHRPEKHQAAQIGFGGPPQLFIRPEKAHQFAAEQQHPRRRG